MSATIQISSRTAALSPSPTFAIDAKAKAMKAEGIDIINFSAGEPDFDTPEHIKNAAMGALDAGFTKYTATAGIPELRAAISEKLKEHNGLNYKPSQIVVSCGAKHACFNSMLALLEPGDEVVVPAPYWVSHPEMVKLAGGTPIIVQTTAQNDYKMTAEQFREAISPRTKMVILNTPSNPTGSIYSEDELAQIAEAALEEEIYMLSDEIYEDLTYDGAKHVSLASLGKEVYDYTLTVNGFSKPYAMTGWRVGYVAAPEPIAKAIDIAQGHSVSHVTSFAQKGALAAYKGPQDCVETMRAEFDWRRQRMMALLDGMPRLSYVRPRGAFYVFVNISRTGMTSTAFAEKLLTTKNVAVVPGIAFGDDSAVRLSYATSREAIEEGMKRLGEMVG